jgi:hypothetical protein
MESSISISEIIGTIYDGEVEVCAAADTAYDRAKEKVIVTLKAFARRVSVHNHGEAVAEPWLPSSEQVTEHLPREDADSFAKDVFHSWTKKVRASVPEALHLHE